MPEDFSLSAELNIQKINVDAAKINQAIDKSSINNLKIKPTISAADLRKALPFKTLPIRLRISNVKAIQDQLKKAFNIDDIVSGLSTKQSSAGSGKTPIVKPTAAKVQTKSLENVAKSASLVSDDIDEATNSLNQFIGRLNKNKGAGLAGGFFETASKDLNKLITDLNTTGVLDRFAGKNGAALRNLTSALEFVFNKTKDLENQRSTLDKLGVLSPALNKQIDEARNRLSSLLSNTEISNISTIKSQVNGFLLPLSKEFQRAEKDAEDFEKAIADLTQRTIQLDKIGRGRSELASNLRSQSSSLQTTRSRGGSFNDAKTINAQLLEEEKLLTNVAKSAEKAQVAVNKVLTTKLNTDINSTLAAQIIGSPQQIEKLANETSEALDKVLRSPNKRTPTNNLTVENLKNGLSEGVKRVEEDTKKLDNILNRVNQKRVQLDNEGLRDSATALGNLTVSLTKMAQAGRSIESVGKFVDEGLINVETLAGRERALNRYISSFNRLRATLSSQDRFPDILGGLDQLDVAEKKLRELSKSGASPIELQKFIAETNVAVRAADKLSQKAGSLANKFAELANVQNTSFKTSVIVNYGRRFDALVQQVLSGSGTINQKLNEIQSGFVRLRAQAAVDAEGGLLGSFAKLSGLAAKRLLSFLVVARLTFGIQDVFLSSVTAALDLEVQVNKLEQVFSKTASTEAELIKRTEAARSSILGLAQDYGVAVGEVAKASRILAQAGFIGNDLEKTLQAIVKANLGPTFNDINQTAEASIAVLNQFNKEASDLEDILGGINQVSSLYAVEAEGIAKAVRKAGGAFNAAGGSIEDFVGSFTILKKETREADEALATALRNISIRLQRTSTQTKVGNILGVDFRDANDQFIGVTKSIGLIKDALNDLGIQQTDPRFAQVVESLAGARQFARLIPLIENFDELNDITTEFANGAGSLDDDAARAITTIQNKLEQLRSTFAELSNTVLTSTLFKTLLDLLNSTVKAANAVISAIDGISFAILALGAISIPAILKRGLFSSFLAETGSSTSTPLLGGFLGRNRGGLIPGRGPNSDTVPAMLTRGEFVLKRSAVDSIGVNKLNEINQKGRAGFNSGGAVGRIGFTDGGAVDVSAILKRFGLGLTDSGDKLVKSIETASSKLFKSVGRPNARGLASRTGGRAIIREGIGRQQGASTLFHELTHLLDNELTPALDGFRSKILESTKGGVFDAFTKSRGVNSKNTSEKQLGREKFADLGLLSIFKDLRDQNGGRSTNIETPKVAEVLNNLSKQDSQILDGVRGILQKQGLTTSRQASNIAESRASNLLNETINVSQPIKQGGSLNKIVTSTSFASSSAINSGPNKGGISGISKSIIPFIKNINTSTKVLGGLALGVGALTATSKFLDVGFGDLATAITLATLTYKLSNSTFNTVGSQLKNFGGDFLKGQKQGSSSLRDAFVPRSLGSKVGGRFSGNSLGSRAAGGIAKIFTGSSQIGIALSSLAKLGPLVIGAGAAFNFLSDAVVKNAEESLSEANTEAQVRAAAAALDFAESLQNGFGIFSTIGGVTDFILGGLSNFGTGLLEAYPLLKNSTQGLSNFGSGLRQILSMLTGTERGSRARLNTNLARVNVGEFSDNLQPNNTNPKQAAKELSEIIPTLTSSIVDGANEAGETYKNFVRNNSDIKGTADKFAEDLSNAVKNGVNLDDLLVDVDPQQFKEFSALLKAVGSDIDVQAIQKSINAIDQISLLFSRMQIVTQNAADRMTAVEGNLAAFDQQFAAISGDSFNFSVPDQAFDLLQRGIDPASNGVATNGLSSTISSLSGADRSALNLEFGINKLSRELNQKIIASGSSIKFDANNNSAGGAIADVLLNNLNGINITKDIRNLYEKFLDANEQDLASDVSVQGGQGTISSEKITDLNQKFAEQFSGAIENLKRRTEIEKSFTDRYKSILEQRITAEQRSRDVVSKISSIRKEQTEFTNSTTRTDGSSSLDIDQARGFDEANIRNILSGTGIQSTSVNDLKSAFQQSIQRSNILRSSGASNRQKTIGLTNEDQFRKQIESAFEALSQGGEGMRASFESFNKTLEETRKTNEKFRSSLLGSDDDLIGLVKGIDAFNVITNNKNQGQARNALLSLSEEERSGINRFIGDDARLKAQFDSAVGFTSPATASPQADAVNAEFAVREEATKAQLEIANMQVASMNNLAKALSEGEKVAIQRMQAEINQAALVSQNLNKAIASMPSEIIHNHNIPDINVRIFGGENLGNLPNEFKKMVSGQIKEQIQRSEADLRRRNRGIN